MVSQITDVEKQAISTTVTALKHFNGIIAGLRVSSILRLLAAE
jgi:hypothetical protein